MTITSLSLAQTVVYNGAEVYTKETYKYGRFEARMQMAAASGTVSSMFLYFNNSYMGLPRPWREVDIEILGKSPESFQSNIISGSKEAQVMSPLHHPINPSSATSYHDYVIEWTPDYIAWFLDGTEVRRTTGQQVTDLQDSSQNLRFNLWSHTDVGWVGPWDDAVLPLNQFISSVRVSSYTPGTGPAGSNFTLLWQDDFNSLDDTRWATADWTFAKNRVTFNPLNVTVKDGAMVLSMTKGDAVVFKGAVPPDAGSSIRLRPHRNITSSMVQLFDLNGRLASRN